MLPGSSVNRGPSGALDRPAEFTQNILPLLAGLSYSELSRRTGLSRRYCKMIAAGEQVPHPMHWAAFKG